MEEETIKVIIVGRGKLEDETKQFLAKYGLQKKIEFRAYVDYDSMPELLNRIRLIVMPSYSEGLPNILLEAMACGTAVLATSVGAIPDIVQDGKTGFILESNNPIRMSERIMKLLNQPEFLEKTAMGGHDYVIMNFGYKRTLEIWQAFLQEV